MVKKILFLAVGIIIGSSRSQSGDSCKIFLDRAIDDINIYRHNIWMHVDGARMDAAVQLTDYLKCRDSR